MIINIKGCSGSGKSTIVRQIMDQYDTQDSVFDEGRKRPIGYFCYSGDIREGLFVVGHYETACGGCDTIKLMDDVFEIVRKYSDLNLNVLFEGLLLTADVNRSQKLHDEGYKLLTLGLDTPLDLCLESINMRRKKAYEGKCKKVDEYNKAKADAGSKAKPKVYPPAPEPVNPYHTTNKHKQMVRVMQRVKDAGLSNEMVNREDCLEIIKKELGLVEA